MGYVTMRRSMEAVLPRARRSRWLPVVRAAAGLALLGFLVAQAGPAELAARLAHVPAGALVVAVALHAATVAASSLRAQRLLAAAGATVPLRRLARLQLVGYALNRFVPT